MLDPELMKWVLIGLGCIAFGLLMLGGVPGSIARKRRHSKAEAITLCGWLGVLIFPCWIVALIWAYTEDNRGRHITS